MIYAKALAKSLSVVQEIHEQSKRDQFLVKPCPKFEAIRLNMMNCSPPSLDVCFSELLSEEQRLATQTTLQQNNITDNVVAYAAHGRGKGRNMQQVQCYSCKEYEHIITYYAKKSCNYCKKLVYIIKECNILPQNCQANQVVVANQVVDDRSTLTPEVIH